MSTKLPGYDDAVICPYNKCHIIMRSRIQTHLVKCARSYPDIQLETCPFDVTHRFRAEEMKKHTNECPSRENYDRYVYSVGSSVSSEPQQAAPRAPPRPPRNNTEDDDEQEDWDHYDAPSYDPQMYARNANVLRHPGLLTPSERRKFADAERKRLSELKFRQ